MTAHKPVAPFYAAAATWLLYACIFPLYAPLHFVLIAAVSILVFALTGLLCRNTGAVSANASAEKEEPKKETEKPTGNPELDKMLKNGAMALTEMKRLDDSISDPDVSADIVRLEEVSQKIFEQVKANPQKLSQIRKFMDYYLPTTLKLLNAYDRASAAGISGENVDSTKKKVEGMMRNVVGAFEKQLDALFGDEALDISTDITVLETMMAREGLTGEQLHAETSPKTDPDIKLEL